MEPFVVFTAFMRPVSYTSTLPLVHSGFNALPVRLLIRVNDGLGGHLHPLQRLCQTHRHAP
jgi:hypothetical protein